MNLPGNPYRVALATPGALGFVLPGFVGRMSISMIGIGLVLLVSGTTGSYGLAGLVAAAFALAQSVLAPVLGRSIDRHGQRRVVVPLVLVHAGAMAVLLVAAEADAPAWTLVLSSCVSGAALPSVGSLVRARWSHLLGGRGPQAMQAAYALESVADEVIFVVGPVLVTLLSTGVALPAGLVAALAFTVTGTLVLAAHRRSEPPAATRTAGTGRSAMRDPAVRAVALVFAGAGVVFSGSEVAVVAFAAERASTSDAGWLLALIAVGSMLSGIAYGARGWSSGLGRRFALGSWAFAFGTVLLALSPNIAVLGAASFVFGLGVSPTLIPGFALVQRHAPQGRLTEAMAWVTTTLGVGLAVGSSAAGKVVDVAGPRAAFLLVAVAGIVTAGLAVTSVRVTAAADRSSTG